MSPTEVSYSTAIGACAKATTALEANSRKVFAYLPVGGSAQPPRRGVTLGRNAARRLVGSRLCESRAFEAKAEGLSPHCRFRLALVGMPPFH